MTVPDEAYFRFKLLCTLSICDVVSTLSAMTLLAGQQKEHALLYTPMQTRDALY